MARYYAIRLVPRGFTRSREILGREGWKWTSRNETDGGAESWENEKETENDENRTVVRKGGTTSKNEVQVLN